MQIINQIQSIINKEITLLLLLLLLLIRVGEFTKRYAAARIAAADMDVMTQASGSKFNHILSGN